MIHTTHDEVIQLISALAELPRTYKSEQAAKLMVDCLTRLRSDIERTSKVVDAMEPANYRDWFNHADFERNESEERRFNDFIKGLVKEEPL